VFRVTGAPLHAFDAARRKLETRMPQVPKVYIESKGREEYNPHDPRYLQELELYEADLVERLYDVAIMLGSEIESVPEGTDRPEDQGWVDVLAEADLADEVPGLDRPKGRYLAWVKYYAAPTVDDNAMLISTVERLMGVTEEGVAEAAKLFRNRAERRANRAAAG